MKTRVCVKELMDVPALLLLAAAAVLMLSGCASDSSSSATMAALTQIPNRPREPITVVAFNVIDPYAPRLQAIESAAGAPVMPRAVSFPAR